jgi:hypothetical protein
VSGEPHGAQDPPSVGRIPPYLRAGTGGPAPGDPGGGAGAPGPPAEHAADAAGGRSAALRPFVLTSGRVDSVDREIGLETQVTQRAAEDGGPRVPMTSLNPEMRAIVGLCDAPISVAEISARLRLHLGVTKILVADLRAAGHLDVHVADTASPLSPETILRVMRGLRAIS